MARSGAAGSAAGSAVVLVVMMALVQGSTATQYTVGGDRGWQMTGPGEMNFYQDWAHSNAPYHTTDFLEFKWIWPESVLQVTWPAFTACNTQGPIQAWPGSPSGEITSMVFPLQGYGFHTLYFISSDARNCAGGQKFFIDVSE